MLELFLKYVLPYIVTFAIACVGFYVMVQGMKKDVREIKTTTTATNKKVTTMELEQVKCQGSVNVEFVKRPDFSEVRTIVKDHIEDCPARDGHE